MVFLMVEWRRSSMFGEVNIAQELLSLVTLFVGRYMALIPPSCECATNWAGVEMLSWANHEFENSLTKNVSRPASLSGRHWLQANSSSSLQSSLLFFLNFFWHFWRLDWCTFFSADVVKPVGFGSEVGCRIELGCEEWCGFLPQRNCRHSGPVCQRVSRAVSAVYHW